MNIFYVIASPIGNLEDLTERAKRILKEEVDCIFCEDTRITGRLTGKLDIKKKLFSCNAHNERQRASQVIDILSEGKNVAYLSDAGTPGISDPGNLLVKEVSDAGFRIVPIPGVSSLACLLSVCGFDLSKGFYFAGFLPRKKNKLKELILSNKILFAFESPYRIRKSLELIKEILPDCEVCIGRELTKLHEEIIRTKISDLQIDNIKEKGEFTLCVSN